MTTSDKEKVFGFDVGKASLGICAREGNTILELLSLNLPADFADTSDFRTRRRAFRTRIAHKMREKWLIDCFQKAGLETFQAKHPLMSREFPAKGDDTLYNSALLRIALLQGKPLQPWQIFKSLWASIQHRGYDVQCDWKATVETEEGSPEANADEKENMESVTKYQDDLNYEVNSQEAYLYPCYLEASLMGLWQFEHPEVLKPRVSMHAKKVREKGRVAPRALVEKEVRALFEKAKEQLPALAAVETDLFLYGQGKSAYASLKSPYKKFRGMVWDSQGVLAQKVPRFDNRIIGKCQVFTSRNTCKAKDPDHLTFKLLQKLKNYKFTDAQGEIRCITPQELKSLYDLLWSKIAEQLANQKPTKVNKTDLSKAFKTVVGTTFNINIPFEEIKLSSSGRARFCRLALKLMNDILFSGTHPPDFDITPYVQTGHANPLTRAELEKAVARFGKTWEKFHIGDQRYEHYDLPQAERFLTIQKVIGSCNNPIVRNRLSIFANQLKKLEAAHGVPDRVILEFIRGCTGLDGKKTSREWETMINTNEKANDMIRKKLEEAGQALSKNNVLRMKLFEEQQGLCPYTGQRLDETQLSNYDIDHIVPVTNSIATDSFYNMVLCMPEANREKQNRTPFEWLNGTSQFEALIERVTAKGSRYGRKKILLLTHKDSREKVESYNGLAETAYIARLAQQIVSLHFGWGLQTEGDKRRVFVNDGKTTAKIRQIYDLNKLLLSENEQQELQDSRTKADSRSAASVAQRKVWKKNRENKKHHALDAFCISYSQQLKMQRVDESGRVHWHVPGLEESKYELTQKLKALFPNSLRRNIKEQYPLETIYGMKQRDELEVNSRDTTKSKTVTRYYLTVTKGLVEMLGKERKKIKDIYDLTIQADLTQKSNEIKDNKEWEAFLKKYRHPLRKSQVKKLLFVESVSETKPVQENGRWVFGEYKDFGSTITHSGYGSIELPKGSTIKQFKRTKANQGQLIYCDKNSKWKVAQIYSHKSFCKLIEELKDNKFYRNGEIYYSGCSIYVSKSFKAGAIELPAGQYKSNSIRADGVAQIENNNGEKFLTSVTYLVGAEFKKIEYDRSPVKEKTPVV